MAQAWHGYTACDLGNAIQSLEIDPEELLEQFWTTIESHPSADSIFARVTKSRARSEVRAAAGRAKNGRRLSHLDGVPVSWKDLFDTAGIRTEAGSALLKGRVPVKDAEVVANASQAGLVCLGKTNMTEFAFSGLGVNPVTGTPPCVNDSKLAPGGSSSGAATSVAFGLAAAAVGSDTGGSVRIPAAWNDLVGLKTTHGVISLQGVVPLCSKFDSVGPICLDVDDASVLFSILAGARQPDLEGASLIGTRFLVAEARGLEKIRELPRRAFEEAVQRLAEHGADIQSSRLHSIDAALPLSGCLYCVEAYARWKNMIERDPEAMYSQVRRRFELGSSFTGIEYAAAWTTLEEARVRYHGETAGFDAILLPTSPIMPPDRERLLSDDSYYESENLLALRNTRVGNLMNVPALTLPTSVPSAGLMLLGRPYCESHLLRIGKAAENALGNNCRRETS